MEYKNNKSQIAGAILTVITSVFGAYAAINARVYELEKRIEIVEIEVKNSKEIIKNQNEGLEKIQELFNRIDKNITEINGKLDLKEDKKWL